ncbi:hypothetical protein [Novosphingobium lentum]|uniref:hypothetical protein n=1 Tax=Novosphingobium lentum TaxID=145287 RepID=UPI0012EE5A61|nr:hypothetical protein [Novosphingobium lentum]
MTGTIDPAACLLRGFAVDFLTAHNAAAAQRIMDPGYRLSIGGHLFDGRDGSYLPATLAQLEQFPGLCVTVHDVIIGEDAMAMRFTEHGVSIRSPGHAAAWGGITLFTTSAGRLRHGWAEEDYFARKRQLKSGVCDQVLPPHQAPWDEPALAPDASTEAAARAFLAVPGSLLERPHVETICAGGPALGQLIVPSALTVNMLFTAGNRAGFHVTCHGSYAGGFADVDAGLTGREVTLPMAGMMTLDPSGDVTRVQVSADRLGLHRHLLDQSRR